MPDIGPSAQHLFSTSAADLGTLLPHLDGDEEAAEAQRLGEQRDRLRELFGGEATPPAEIMALNAAERIEAQAAELCAHIYRQIGTAYTLIRQAGPPPLSDTTRAHLCEGWKCAVQTLVNTAAIPGLDLATLDSLETLGSAADSLRALWDDGQPAEG